MKFIEQLAMNYLLKRGYQITLPKIYFSGEGYEAYGSASYWQPITNRNSENRVEKKDKTSHRKNQNSKRPIA